MSVVEKIKPVSITEKNVGQIMSFSKKKYSWKFEHFDHEHEFSLIVHMLSQRFQLLFDDKFTEEGYRPYGSNFEYNVNIHDLDLTVQQSKSGSYELYINHEKFIPNVPIKVVNHLQTDYLQSVIKSSTNNSFFGEVINPHHDKVIFGAEDLRRAEEELNKCNFFDKKSMNFNFKQNNNHFFEKLDRPKSASTRTTKTVKKSVLNTPLNLHFNSKPKGDYFDVPVVNAPPSPIRYVDNFFEKKQTVIIKELSQALLMGDLFEYEKTIIENYLPTRMENQTVEVKMAIENLY